MEMLHTSVSQIAQVNQSPTGASDWWSLVLRHVSWLHGKLGIAIVTLLLVTLAEREAAFILIGVGDTQQPYI